MTDIPGRPVAVENVVVDGPHGPLPLRTYLPQHPERGIVWVHGGAFAFGDLDQPESDWVARELAARGTAVVTVDYRLAPIPEWLAVAVGQPVKAGDVYPVASEEVTAAFRSARCSVAELEPELWSLGGASAGANLAAGAALRLRDEGDPGPRGLLLAYGVFHAALPPLSVELGAKYAAQPPELQAFTPEAVRLMNTNYVGDPVQLDQLYAFPGGHDLDGLPPTFLLNADVDSLRASGEAFGSELAAAGVDVLVIREEGTVHGHLDRPDLPAAGRSIERMSTWLASALVSGRAR